MKTIMQLSYALMYDRKDFFILNCFALGPWATGMNVAMSLVDVAIMKSIGPDKAKLENALRQFGPQYRYLIAGYPPFIKNFVDTTTLNLREFELHLVVGGEGISEGLREYFQQWFKTIFSSYGASDLEINIGAETAFTIALRRLCWKDPRLSKSLFGREDPPMIFQYNPLDYYIEQNADGEAIFTLTRASNVAPKIRYNLHDRGGIYRHAELIQKMHELGVSPPPVRASSLPILFIYGRNDLSVPFYGCKVFTTDLDNIIYQDPLLARRVNSFQIENEENAQFDRLLHVHLEQAEGVADFADESYLHEVVFEGLKRVNQDFREISRMITPAQVRVSVHRYGTGPFSGRDIRVKSRYVAGNS